MKYGDVLDLWKTVVDNRQEWRRLIRTVCESHEIKRVKGGRESQREETKEVKTIKLYCVLSVIFGFIAVLLS